MAAQDNFTNKTNEVFNLNSELNNEFTAEKIVKIFFDNWEGKVPEIIITKEEFEEVDILKINSTKAMRKKEEDALKIVNLISTKLQ